jgi:phosphatidylglycerol:prolipoprotein diacylglycerol transferase
MAVGFLAAWQVAAWLCRRTGRSEEPLASLLTWMMVCGVLGSRIAYVIEHWQSEFAAHPERIIRIDQGGLMFYGGLLLSIAVFFVWCRVRREAVLPLADLLTTVIPLGHLFGRIGCFFYGCCYGKISDSPIAVSFPRGSPAWYEQLNAAQIASSAKESLAVMPTQLFEAAANLCLFAVLFWVYRKRGRGTLALYLIGYALIRFGMEYLRGDPRAAVGPFSISQTISIGLLAAGIALTVRYAKK